MIGAPRAAAGALREGTSPARRTARFADSSTLPCHTMPLDTHTRVAAFLHIVLASLALLVLLAIGAIVGAFGALGPSWGVEPEVASWVGGVGLFIVLMFVLAAITEIVGAVLLLRGSDFGRVMTIVFSGLHLLNIPLGTAVGAYSLWALLREVPSTGRPGSAVRMEPTQPS